MARILTLALCLFLAAPPVFALQPDEILSDPALEARARALSENLRCLVCQNQSIDDSNAPLARDLRLLIRERLKAGDSDAAAIDFIVARYGDFVLLKPRFSPQTWLLWLGPFLLLVAACALLILRARRDAIETERKLDEQEEEALARALDRRS